MSKKIVTFQDFKTPTRPGSYHCLQCLTGKNKGITYVLEGPRLIMGRSDKIDIQVVDAKSSREHVELSLLKDSYIVTDLGSQNGIVVNDLKVSQHTLKVGDKLIIGQTVYQYSFIVIQSELDKKPEVKDRDDDDDDEDDEEEEESTDDKSKTSSNKGGPAEGKKKKLIIGGVLACVVAYLFLGGSDSPPPPAKVENKQTQMTLDPGAMTKDQKDADKELKENVAAAIHRGLREFREENYFRAIGEFSMVLVMDPKNGRASFYLAKSKQSLDQQIEKSFMKARQDEDALKYDGAAVSYCAIMRYLGDYRDDDRYKKAKESLEKVEANMGYEKGEISCE